MAIYLYACECGHTQEATHSISFDPDILCEECGAKMFRRPQSTGISFKGTGWGHQA